MKATIYLVDIILAAGILYFGWSANDKLVIVAYSLYVVLFALNVMFGLLAQMDDKPVYKHYYVASVVLALVGIISQMIS
jgi:hypothetical protein